MVMKIFNGAEKVRNSAVDYVTVEKSLLVTALLRFVLVLLGLQRICIILIYCYHPKQQAFVTIGSMHLVFSARPCLLLGLFRLLRALTWVLRWLLLLLRARSTLPRGDGQECYKEK
jgi:hypothetical protein